MFDEVQDPPLGELVAHRVDPLRVVDDLLRHDERLAQLVADPAHLVAQLGRVDELLADLLVVAVGGAAVDHREVAGLVGRPEVAHRDGGLGALVGGRRGVVVPGRAGGLVRRVVVVEPELADEPEDRGRVAGDVAALAARLVVPGPGDRDLLDPAVLRGHPDPRLGHALDEPLALRPRARRPSRGCPRSAARVGPRSSRASRRVSRTVSGIGIGDLLSRPSEYPASSSSSSMTSLRIMWRPASTSLIMSSTPGHVPDQVELGERLVVHLPGGRGGVHRVRRQGAAATGRGCRRSPGRAAPSPGRRSAGACPARPGCPVDMIL